MNVYRPTLRRAVSVPEDVSIVRRVSYVSPGGPWPPPPSRSKMQAWSEALSIELKSKWNYMGPHWWGQEIDGSPSWAPTPVITTLVCAPPLQNSRFLLQ